MNLNQHDIHVFPAGLPRAAAERIHGGRVGFDGGLVVTVTGADTDRAIASVTACTLTNHHVKTKPTVFRPLMYLDRPSKN